VFSARWAGTNGEAKPGRGLFLIGRLNWRRASRRPLNLHDALRMTIAGSGEIQDQAGWPGGERAKVAHGLCDHRDVGFNLDLHVWGVAAKARPQILDCLGCVSHSGFPLR
jgi:hypothetical protein